MKYKASLRNELQLRRSKSKYFIIPSAALLLFTTAFICVPYVSSQLKVSATSSGNTAVAVGIGDAWASLSTTGDVPLDAGAVMGDTIIIGKADAIAKTNVPTGYKLYLSASNDVDSTSAMSNGSATISSLPASTTKAFGDNDVSANTWGYATKGSDVTTNFSGTYSEGVFKGSTLSQVSSNPFKGFIVSGSGVGVVPDGQADPNANGIIAQSNTPNVDGAITNVYYAAYLDNSTPAGTYVANVTYTLAADFTSTVDPNDPVVNPGTDPNRPTVDPDTNDRYAYRDNTHYYYYNYSGSGVDQSADYYYYDAEGSKVTAQGVNKSDIVASVATNGNITWAAVAIVAGASATFLAVALLRDREEDEE